RRNDAAAGGRGASARPRSSAVDWGGGFSPCGGQLRPPVGNPVAVVVRGPLLPPVAHDPAAREDGVHDVRGGPPPVRFVAADQRPADRFGQWMRLHASAHRFTSGVTVEVETTDDAPLNQRRDGHLAAPGDARPVTTSPTPFGVV